MPNWCEGVFKIRGTKQQISDYLTEYLRPVDWLGIVTWDLKVEISDDCISIEPDLTSYKIDEERKEFIKDIAVKKPEHFWFKGSRRAFVEGQKLFFDFLTDDPEEEIIITLDNFKQAWGIRSEDFAEGSKKYDVDIKIFGFECGMEFTQEIEIIKGEVTMDEENSYTDYH